MKHDKLESFIIKNKDSFDNLEPAPELWNKIANTTQIEKVRKINWNSILWKAAAVIIIFFASYFVHDYINQPEQLISQSNENEITFSYDNEQMNELIEAEAYYVSRISITKNKLNQYANLYPEITKDLMNEFSELDSTYVELKKDLSQNISNQQVIEAMVQNYRIKLQILKEVLSIIESENNYDNNNESKNQKKYEV